MPDIRPTPTPSARPKPSAKSTPRRLYGMLRLEAHRWRGFFTRESIFSALRTLAWVIPLTLLIWIYAEREQLATDDGVPFPIDVKSSDPNRVVRLIKPVDNGVIADLTGPRARLDRMRELIRPQGDRIPIQIEIPSTLPPGDHQIPTIVALEDHQMFIDMGIAVDDCQPPQLTVRVDELVEREVPVVVPESFRNRLDAPPIFVPSTVKIRGPKALIEEYEQRAGGLQAVANLDPGLPGLQDLARPGPHEVSEVAVLSPIRDDEVTLSTKTVSASVTVKQSDVEYVYPSMPVWTLRPKNFPYDVEYEEFVANVTLVGPPDLIEAISRPNFAPKPMAYFKISSDDLPVGVRKMRRLEYDLPDGIQVKDKTRDIAFELSPPAQND